MADPAVLDAKPSVKPKFTRGALPPLERGTKRLHVTPTVADFTVREEETPPPARPNRFTRGDRLPAQPPSGLVRAADAEPFIRPPS
jgi:hypothetical protein